jgi:alpha-L-rhamnosidase
LIDKLWWATNNSYLSNLYGFPTDCPQREKNGWTGDGHFAIETGLYNFDGITVYEKWMGDHRDEQQPNGVSAGYYPDRWLGLWNSERNRLDQYHRDHPMGDLPFLWGQ